MSTPTKSSPPQPSRWIRSRADWAGAKRWLGDCFSKDSLIGGAKTLLWLVPMTVLIWVYAEREQEVTSDNQSIPIEVASNNDPTWYVELEQPQDRNVLAQLRGPRARVYDVTKQIDPQGKGTSLQLNLNVPANTVPGQTIPFDAAELLSANPIFAGAGVTVISTNPSQLRVFVDKYTDREVTITASESITNLAGAPTFVPSTVTVRAPASKLKDIASDEPLIYADLASTQLLDKPGQHPDVIVPIKVYSGYADDIVTIVPTEVKATFAVLDVASEWECPKIVVYVQMPQNLQLEKVALCENVITNVPLVGPPDQIAILRDGSSSKTPKAILDAVRGGGSAQLRFSFPEETPGVRVKPDRLPITLDYRLVDRAPVE